MNNQTVRVATEAGFKTAGYAAASAVAKAEASAEQKQSDKPAMVTEFECACVLDTLTTRTIPLQLVKLKESLDLLAEAWSGLGDVNGKTPEAHPEDAQVHHESLQGVIGAAKEVVDQFFIEDARRAGE